MLCFQCGGQMRSTVENYHYTACGLPGITLVGMEVNHCESCGDREVSIPNIEGLHRQIAKAVIRKPRALAPAEVRFLRKFLDLTQVELAQHAGVAPETVSRWENGSTPASTGDRLLRLMVAIRFSDDYSIGDLARITADTQPVRISLVRAGESWKAAGLTPA